MNYLETKEGLVSIVSDRNQSENPLFAFLREIYKFKLRSTYAEKSSSYIGFGQIFEIYCYGQSPNIAIFFLFGEVIELRICFEDDSHLLSQQILAHSLNFSFLCLLSFLSHGSLIRLNTKYISVSLKVSSKTMK